MGLRFRPMAPKDVPECAEIIATHPVVGPRYGRTIQNLERAWLRLLSCDAMRATVFQFGEGARAPICVVGVSLFVTDEFVEELKAPPGFWFGPELAKRILGGNAPILSAGQLRERNSRGGLNLVVWEGCIRHEFEQESEIHRGIISGFIEEHRGFLLKEIIASQVESADRLLWTLKTGGMLWNPQTGAYMDSAYKDPEEIVRKPHLIGVTRTLELQRPGSWVASWVGALFDYHPPKCGFSRSEQRLLVSALPGKTDAELASELRISLLTIKNIWRSIYNRAAAHLPEQISDPGRNHDERGKEKRRRLLAYLREHPEELRPISRRVLRQNAGE